MKSLLGLGLQHNPYTILIVSSVSTFELVKFKGLICMERLLVLQHNLDNILKACNNLVSIAAQLR